MTEPTEEGVETPLDIYTGTKIDPSVKVFTDVDLSKMPVFKTTQVAEVFFQRSGPWLRWLEREKFFVDPDTGVKLHIPRDPETHIKLWSLKEIEELADILYRNGRINPQQVLVATIIMRYVAIGWGVL